MYVCIVIENTTVVCVPLLIPSWKTMSELTSPKNGNWKLKSPKSGNWKVPRVEIEKSQESKLKSPKSRNWKVRRVGIEKSQESVLKKSQESQKPYLKGWTKPKKALIYRDESSCLSEIERIPISCLWMEASFGYRMKRYLVASELEKEYVVYIHTYSGCQKMYGWEDGWEKEGENECEVQHTHLIETTNKHTNIYMIYICGPKNPLKGS
jgi:hypothetical protein